jgi:hypothetical protein
MNPIFDTRLLLPTPECGQALPELTSKDVHLGAWRHEFGRLNERRTVLFSSAVAVGPRRPQE